MLNQLSFMSIQDIQVNTMWDRLQALITHVQYPLDPYQVCYKHGHNSIQRRVLIKQRGGENYWDMYSDWVGTKVYCKRCGKNYKRVYDAKRVKSYSACSLTPKQHKQLDQIGYIQLKLWKKDEELTPNQA